MCALSRSKQSEQTKQEATESHSGRVPPAPGHAHVAQAHVHGHAHTGQTHIQGHAHTPGHTRMAQAHIREHAHTQTRVRGRGTHTRTRVHTWLSTHTGTCTHMYSRAHPHMGPCTHTDMHTWFTGAVRAAHAKATTSTRSRVKGVTYRLPHSLHGRENREHVTLSGNTTRALNCYSAHPRLPLSSDCGPQAH